MKFHHLEIGDTFTIQDGDPFDQFKKISDTRAVRRTYPLEWGKQQFPFRTDIEITPLNAKPISTWEEFQIEITHQTTIRTR